MPDLTLVAPPPRTELREELRPRLGEILPGSQLLAIDLLGAGASIDFVVLEPRGAVVLVLVGTDGDDLELVGLALAQRAWVEARLRDWLQLAPHLGIRPEAGARVLLLCPSFRAETRAAAETLGSGAVGLIQYRCVRNGAGTEALVEPLFPGPTAAPASTEPPPSAAPEAFRTGLTDSDLGLTDSEPRGLE